MTSDRGRRAACIVTLGCPRNEVDSESFAAVIRRAGYRIVRDPEEAVLLLLNTCAFIAPAVEESVEALSEALAWRAGGGGRRFVLAGCLPGRFGDDGSGGLEGIDALVGPADTASLAAFLGVDPDARGRSRISRRFDRYLKIADGCLNRCSFCVLPAIRGPFRPASASGIIAEAGDLAASGAREIGVVAQDLLAWRDGSMGPADLVSELASRHPRTWFRLYYLNPRRFDESILEAMNRFRNLAPYLDIPVQHASDRVLARMNRGYGRAALERICDLVSHAGFDIACRFTVIAGYPGETAGDFEDLCSFLRGASSLRSLVVFPYWHEEGSVEYGRGDDDLVDPAIVDERLGILDSIGEEAAEAWGGRLPGRRIPVLAESSRRGRTVFDAPMVDGSVLFTSPVRAGAFHEAIVEGCEGLSTTVTVSGGN